LVSIRLASLPEDAEAINTLDTSFTTNAVYEVTQDDAGFSLTLKGIDPPLWKRFPIEDLLLATRPWRDAWLAEDGTGSICGFAAASYEAWNSRLIIWHLYVAPAFRRHGVGRALLDAIHAHASALGARHVWLETSSLNAPGVAAYRSLGFSLTGLDLTLYDGTAAEGEVALFFSRPV
jgi:ribosomal protein S18 acetylase RimI-like enzyme